MAKMEAYLGFSRDTVVPVTVEVVCCATGVGRVTCFECGGDGDWSKFHPEPHTLTEAQKACVNCKGTGQILISI